MATLNVGDLFNVRGRIALVTGGTSGIGFMIASVRERSIARYEERI